MLTKTFQNCSCSFHISNKDKKAGNLYHERESKKIVHEQLAGKFLYII